jgi:predicted HTH transcriptional regulator
MTPLRLFISSVQKEFAEERAALRDYLRGDALLRRFFEAFLFEEVPAADRRADELYLDEVERCDVDVGVFGNEYGFEDAEGVSPTQRHKHRLIFVKGADDRQKHPKMQALIRQAGAQVIRRRFATSAELIAGVYAALVQYLERKQLIRSGPFDAAGCADAVLADLSTERIQRFVGIARRARGFPLAEDTAPVEVLEHLHLLRHGSPTHAAVLLFGTAPQRFLISSEIKCVHFHGTEVQKPIPSYQVYRGTVFELVDQAVDFVLSKINLAVGTRAESTQAPVAYEMPPEVVREAIVNAVAHRDYTSNGSVQVMLFADRLEVWNPGSLPPSLTLEMLRHPHGSVPGNPLLAEPLYLTKYIERMGTGTGDMIERCRKAGLPEPEFKLTDGFVIMLRRKPEGAFKVVGGQVTPSVTPPVTGEVTGEVTKLLIVCVGTVTRKELQHALVLKGEENFRKLYLTPALESGYVEMTIPDKPKSSRQKYRLTLKGKALQDRLHQRYQSA